MQEIYESQLKMKLELERIEAIKERRRERSAPSPEFIYLDRLALALAQSAGADKPREFSSGLAAGYQRAGIHDFEKSVLEAATAGRFKLFNELTRLEVSPVRATLDCLARIKEAREWLTGQGMDITIPGDAAEPDHVRRLRELRALGGDVRWLNGKWEITGIEDLARREKAGGRGRYSEKTVRKDLIRAAEDERNAKRAGAPPEVPSWYP